MGSSTFSMHSAKAGAVLAAGLLALTGCGSGPEDTDPGASATAAAGAGATSGVSSTDGALDLPQGWRHVAGETDFSDVTAEPRLPVTVTDGTGTEVEVTDASRIISSGDTVSSTLGALGLGDAIQAAPEDSAAPAGVNAPEHFVFNKTTGVEGLLAMDGTLFIGDNTSRHGDVAERFRQAGVGAVVVDDQQDQVDKLEAIASYVGDPDAGRALAGIVQRDLEQAEALAEESGLEDLAVIQVTATGAGGQNAVAGNGVPGTEVVEDLGMTSVGMESGLRGFSVEFSSEGLVASDPDIILMAESDWDRWGGEDGFWEAFPSLRDTTAGREGNIIVMPDAQLRYTSPEVGAGAKALVQALAEDQETSTP